MYASGCYSKDGGINWQKNENIGSSLAINHQNTNELYTIVYGKNIYRSVDKGENWDLLYSFRSFVDEIDISQSDTNTLYAVGNDSIYGLYRSNNSGREWERTNCAASNINKILIHPENSQCVYVGSLYGLYKTTDGGYNWNILSNEFALNDFSVCWQDTNIIYLVTGDYYSGTVGNVYKTNNGGKTWESINDGLPEENNRYIYNIETVQTSCDELYIGTYGYGVYKKHGANAWEWTNLVKSHILNISFHPYEPDYIYTGTPDEGIFLSTDGGEQWSLLSLGINTTIQSFCRNIVFNTINPNIAYVTAGPYGVLKSTDGGINWYQTNFVGSFDSFAWSIAVHPENPDTIYCGKAGYLGKDLFRSIDGGNTWTNLLLTDNTASIEDIKFSPKSSEIIFICASEVGFYISNNSGETWTQANNGLIITDYPLVSQLKSVAINNQGNVIYIAQKDGLRRSDDLGNNWVAIDSTLNIIDCNISLSDICISPLDNKLILISLVENGQINTPTFSPGGVYFTYNDGKAWKNIFKGSCNRIVVNPHNLHEIYIATKYGIYSQIDSVFLDDADYEILYPQRFKLYQNYPNPFNSMTIIPYYSGSRDRMILTIYDLLGRKVYTDVTYSQKSEINFFSWDGYGTYNVLLPSGIYLCTIRSLDNENISDVKFLHLLK